MVLHFSFYECSHSLCWVVVITIGVWLDMPNGFHSAHTHHNSEVLKILHFHAPYLIFGLTLSHFTFHCSPSPM